MVCWMTFGDHEALKRDIPRYPKSREVKWRWLPGGLDPFFYFGFVVVSRESHKSLIGLCNIGKMGCLPPDRGRAYFHRIGGWSSSVMVAPLLPTRTQHLFGRMVMRKTSHHGVN